MPLLDAPFGFRARRPQLLMPDPFPVTPEMPLRQAVWLGPFDAAWLSQAVSYIVLLNKASEIVVGI